MYEGINSSRGVFQTPPIEKNMQFAYILNSIYICIVMKINLVKWVNILDRIEKDKDMEKAFVKFYQKLKEVEWSKPNDILNTFNTADIINCTDGNRVIFNVGGNKYRLICGYYFGKSIIQLFVKFVGTHKEYDSIDACNVNMYKR